MSQLIFPIVESRKNKLISITGNVGRFFEVIAPDQEQMSLSEIERFYQEIASSLDQLSEKYYFKFYSWKWKNYFETNAPEVPKIAGVEFVPCHNPLDIFFGNSELISDIGIYQDYLSFNGEYWRVLSVQDFKEDAIASNPIPIGINYVLSFRPQAQHRSIGLLERIRSAHLNSFFKSKRDPRSEGAYQQAEELLEDLTHGRERLFSFELFVVVRGPTLEKLNEYTKNIYNELASHGIKTLCEGQSLRHLKSGLGELFNELIPGVKPKLGLRKLPNKTGHLRYLLPLFRSHLMDEGQEFADIYGSELFLDILAKEFPNRNILISGASGFGKSVMVNKLVHPLIPKHPTVILDMGASFKRLTLYHGGSYLKHGINPMQFRDAEFLREIILSQVDLSKFDKLERGRLLKSLRAILEDNSVVTFRSLLERLEADFKHISLYFEECLESFSDEVIGDVNLLYVDIQDYSQAMVTPVILFALEYYKRIKVSQKILVFDECWEFLTEHASFITKSFRTIRKTGGLAIAISQGLEDFAKIDRELSRAIINNAYFRFFFPQELTPNESVSEFDIERINQLRFVKNVVSECYLVTKNQRFKKILGIYLSSLERELFHTEDGEDQPLMNYLNEKRAYFASNSEAIEAFVRLRYGENNHYLSV
ncbi:MAG: hypothetical protein COV38_13305 [Bdellovibrionales bacterium CG11_big_fil_rev_8_21_14_0_20_38_13]|nr:MAG: hypothetical protein COW79_04335 [Bdellovibrionales bacterium CG22_combo_CG10-13_8_21_14_all_38_13]PIR28920.1 MAG: hypothetical protein COV38_13305 [Bdellovibrionales bacterium CG11_big_fil_rev_8_21_14_0_20_38_13]